mgnify:CR=1 FL=1
MPLHGVFKAALNGAHYRGDGGFVYVKGEECAYLFPREFRGRQPDAATTLEELLQDEKAKQVFYVAEEREGQLHILAYPRERVLSDMVEEAREASTESRIEDVD